MIENDSDFLRNLRVKNVNTLIIRNMNINTISNKFYQLKLFVQGKVDMLIVTETEFDSTFPTSQFMIDVYREPYPFDRNRNGSGVLIYIREEIPSKLLGDRNLSHDIEGIFAESNLRKKEVITFWSYDAHNQSDEYFLNRVKKCLDMYNKSYERRL